MLIVYKDDDEDEESLAKTGFDCPRHWVRNLPNVGPSESFEQSEPETACEMKAGTGLASSLLPREVASQEDFGEFAPEDILAGQNFLEPRAQVGFPETVSGALRNANQQIRADPPNTKEPFVWNNSTIASDTMRRPLC